MPNLLQFRPGNEEDVNLFDGEPYTTEFYNEEVDEPQYLLPVREETDTPVRPIPEYDVPPNPLENVQPARYNDRDVPIERATVPVAPRAVSVPKKAEEDKPWYSSLAEGAKSLIMSPNTPLAYFYDSNTPYGQMMDRYHQFGTQKMKAQAAMMNAMKQKSDLGNVGKTIRDMRAAGYSDVQIDDYLMKSNSTNITLGEKTEDKIAGDRLGVQLKGIDTGVSQYLGSKASLDRLEEAFSSGRFPTGGGKIGATLSEIGVDLGLSDTDKARNLEDLRVVFGHQMGKILDSLNVGAISDSERTMFAKLAVSLGKTPEANLQLIRAMKLAGDLSLDTQKYYNAQIAGKGYSAAQQKRMLDDYVQNRSNGTKERLESLYNSFESQTYTDPNTGKVYRLKPRGQ